MNISDLNNEVVLLEFDLGGALSAVGKFFDDLNTNPKEAEDIAKEKGILTPTEYGELAKELRTRDATSAEIKKL